MQFADAMLNLGVLLSFFLISFPLGAQHTSSPEYQTKANLPSKFPIFIESPEDAVPLAKAPFLICVFLDFLFGTSLAEKTRGPTAPQRGVAIDWVHQERDSRSSQILFASPSERKRYSQVLEAAREQGVLAAGETTELFDVGGIVSVAMQRELQLETNHPEANKGHLNTNSQTLARARRATNNIEAKT